MSKKGTRLLIMLLMWLVLFSGIMTTFGKNTADSEQSGTSIGASDESTLKEFFQKGLLAAIKWGAYGIALGVLIVLGIKYLISPAYEKANIKGKFVPYVIGVFLLGLCGTLPELVADIAGNKGTKANMGAAIQLAGGTEYGYTEYAPRDERVGRIKRADKYNGTRG